MEFHIPKSSDSQCFQESFGFSPQDLADIPCPDDICPQAEGSPQEDELLLPPGTSIDDFPDLPLPPGTSGVDFPDLPPPPGTSGDDFPIPFPIPLPPERKPFDVSNKFSPFLPKHKAPENTLNLLHPEPGNFNILPFDEDSQLKADTKTGEFQDDVSGKQFLDESKYSPSKVDSDEENQDFASIKPKVLGKEQAKKRLMAFSLSKQPSTSVKKQSKTVTPAKNKEKPPNPNKGSNVQEQFRATISAIEEEKKKMFQNMPSYLLLEMSELTKSSHTSMSSSMQLLERLKNENSDSKSKDNSGKDGNTSSKSTEGKSKRSFHKSRSRSKSKSKKLRRSRSKRRSRSRTRRSRSRSRRRSYSRSRGRRYRDKNYKTDKISRDTQSAPKRKMFEDWNSFKAAGLSLENESKELKGRSDEVKSRRDEHHRRSRSPNDRPDFKPIFNYLNKGCNPMVPLQAKPADPGSSNPVFLEKNIKYTRTKPILCWSENPSRATEFYMSKQMLLENCDESIGSILLSVMENKKSTPSEGVDLSETMSTKTRPWYPREGYLLSVQPKTTNVLEGNEPHPLKKTAGADDFIAKEGHADNKEDCCTAKEDSKRGKVSLERKISLVNDSYLSDEEEQVKDMVVGEVKVRLDLDMNRVKVRSRWDSDYEGENSEKDSVLNKEEKRETSSPKIQIEGSASQVKDALIDDFDVAPCHEAIHDYSGKKKSTSLNVPNLKVPHVDSTSLGASDTTTGNLVSEYEEFLKMVSVDSSNIQDNQKERVALDSKPKTEKSKVKKMGKSNEEDQKVQSPKLGATDWDQESDHEEKSLTKKMQFTSTGSHDEFLILRKNENPEVTLEKSKKKLARKKNEKPKSKKKKLLKKSSKAKKKKFEDSLSEEDSSSESYESDSDSDSEESESSKKKKKKKISRTKKKSKKESSSESDSDSEENKTKKKKTLKKKGKKKKSSSSDDNDEVQTALLKQLDFKKQLIMKKIEEIDSISDRSSKKKEKEGRGKKKDSPEESDSDRYMKSGKKKKAELKIEKDKKKSKYGVKKGKLMGKGKKFKKSKSSTESDSDSGSSDESVKKKKTKKGGKRKRYTSESSDSEEKPMKLKSKSSKTLKKTKKAKRESSSSDSDDSDDDSSRDRKMTKKGNKVKNGDEKVGKMTELNFKENLLLDEPDAKCEEHSVWESKKLWKKPEGKSNKMKEEDDWEASSSVEESEQERRTRESSWDDEHEVRESKVSVPGDNLTKSDRKKTPVVSEKETNVNNSTDTSEVNNQLSSEALKTSLSNYSFNENSFCSFGQELSRDFFLTERSYSNSGNISNGDNFRTTLIDPRPFQSVSKDAVVKKPADSELYSPGYSDSELSEAEMSKSEKANSISNTESGVREDVYDPLNCDSEVSVDNNEIELGSIPLPHVPETLLTSEAKTFENIGVVSNSSNSEGSVLRDLPRNEISGTKLPCMTPPVKSCFTSCDFTPVATSQSPFTEDKSTPTKRQLMSVRGQQKLMSKAASVFQDESDENTEPVSDVRDEKKVPENIQIETSLNLKEKNADETKVKKTEKPRDEKEKDHGKKRKKETRSRSRERSAEREGRRRRSRSRESKDSCKTHSKKASSPRRRKSKTPEINREKREIRSDSFEIEPLKSSIDADELTDMVQPIPVLTGLEASSSEGLWSRSLVSGCEFSHTTDNLIDHAESFDIYPSEESNFRNRNYDKDYVDHDKTPVDKSRDQKSKKERRKSRSRSYSPRKKLRSKSPERRKSPRNRSPRRKSASPKRRDKSPFSPRRRSPKRKSPSRRYKISRSPDKRRKSPSRSPRKRRGSPSRRSRSTSPRKYRSPKHREESPRKKDSPLRTFGPKDRFSPRNDIRYNQPYTEGLQNRIPVIGTASEDIDMELSPSAMRSPFEDPMGFPRHLPDSSVTEPEMYGSFYEGEYADEFGASSYPEEVGVNNLITVKNHDIEKTNSPERLSLDQRIELELGVPMSGSQTQSDQYQMSNQVCPPFQEITSGHFSNSYNCENTNISNDNFYQNQNVQMNTDFNGQYFNGHQQQPPPSYGSFQQYPNSQPAQNSVLQVGNIVEVVPTLQPPPPPPMPPKTPQIMQVGNVLQVVPSQKTTSSVPSTHNYGPPDTSPMVKTQKATAVVAPSSIVPTPNPEAVLNPLIKAIQLEREKKRKEKEKRKAEREARRKARQLRREAKLMSVNEKLKKSVQNEGLMLGQEVEDDELLDGLDVPSPPIPVEIITVSSISTLPPAGKGILITAGFMPKPPSEKKEVKFADGVCPGEGTSTSGGEEIASPPPKPKLPKEKRFKKRKTKVKKKVKVQIIKQFIQEDDDDEDDLSPPPPPPGDPPLVFFAKFPFASDTQFPVYQTQTTTTTLTTVQYPTQTFE